MLLLIMNIKNTVILIIFLLSVLGLILGVYYTEEAGNADSHESSYERIYDEKNGVETVTLEKKEKNELSKYFT